MLAAEGARLHGVDNSGLLEPIRRVVTLQVRLEQVPSVALWRALRQCCDAAADGVVIPSLAANALADVLLGFLPRRPS